MSVSIEFQALLKLMETNSGLEQQIHPEYKKEKVIILHVFEIDQQSTDWLNIFNLWCGEKGANTGEDSCTHSTAWVQIQDFFL